MSSFCGVCLGENRHQETHHADCVKTLFGTQTPPVIEVELAKLHTLGLAMVGHTSLSGVQRKISVGLNQDRTTLRVALEGAHFLLKPQAQTFPHLPENEHLTMRLAVLAGIEVPPCGLFRLMDDSIAYLVARFDRPAGGGKLRQEDFCQLAEKSPKQKYEGSAELCARLVRRYASEPLIELLKLYRLLVFGWWTANGDMHLKNLSLLASPEGRQRLSPAYDLLCTQLVIPDDQLALPVTGNRDRLTRRAWLELADYCGIGRKAAERVLNEMFALLPAALELVGRSALPAELKEAYGTILASRTSDLVPQGA
jgi:serine/threonine-protein kinase HipA